MAEALERYQRLGLQDSLSLPYRYPVACRELSVILRLGYSKVPKPLQSLLFDHTIAAFRFLPQMQTQSAVSAANLLIQSAEAAFPKQKRVLAATEFKQAKIAYKRHVKTQQEGKDMVQLPRDVLVHLFSFLDMQSLVSAGLVCRSWNAAANDNYLWQFHYNTHFGDSDSFLKMEGLQGARRAEDRQYRPSTDVSTDASFNWKDAFRRAYLGLPTWRYKFNRGYCDYCNSIVWLNNLKCPNKHYGQRCENRQRLRPVSPGQIVRYITDETAWLMYSSDSESESDEELGFKFWASIRH